MGSFHAVLYLHLDGAKVTISTYIARSPQIAGVKIVSAQILLLSLRENRVSLRSRLT